MSVVNPDERYGKLVVIGEAEPRYESGHRRRWWWVRCDCGREYEIRQQSLRSGTTRCNKGECNPMYGKRGPLNPRFGMRVTEPKFGPDNHMFGRNGSAHHRWKGDDIGYGPMHKRVHKERGPAREHACVDTGLPAQEWSWVGCDDFLYDLEGKYASVRYCTHIEHYVPRTTKAHRQHDARLRARAREKEEKAG